MDHEGSILVLGWREPQFAGGGLSSRPESGRADSNRRRPAWEAGILPLNYARKVFLLQHLQSLHDHAKLPNMGLKPPIFTVKLPSS